MLQAFDQIQSFLKLNLISLGGSFFFTFFFFNSSYQAVFSSIFSFLFLPTAAQTWSSFDVVMFLNMELEKQLCRVRQFGLSLLPLGKAENIHALTRCFGDAKPFHLPPSL